jgi:hypothetical protein
MDRIKDGMSSPITVGPATPMATVLATCDRHEFNAFPVGDQHYSVQSSAPLHDRAAKSPGCRQAVEILIDEITEQSFPASDPPAWGIASSRLEQAVWCAPADHGVTALPTTFERTIP